MRIDPDRTALSMARYGYACVSSIHQDCVLQAKKIQAYCCRKISTFPMRAFACGFARSVPPGSGTPLSTKVTLG